MCFAGSIVIIGVTTVLAVSQGTRNYIYSMQNDMLSSNPVTITAETLDFNSIMSSRSRDEKSDAIKASVKDGYVNVEDTIAYLVERSGNVSSYKITNDITDEYVSYVKAMPKGYYSAITTNFGLNLSNNIYTEFKFDGATKKASLSTANQTYRALFDKTVFSDDAEENEKFKSFSDYISLVTESFMQSPSDENFILSQYDILSDPSKSKIATEADEIMIVVKEDTALSDLTLAQYGYYSQKEFFNIIYKAIENGGFDESLSKERFSYDELINTKFVWYSNDDVR